MGNIVGILSTVILVSTLVTLVFAVMAYIGARRRPAKSGAPKHAGDYHVPTQAGSPELPQEFVLSMHDVHTHGAGGASSTPSPGSTAPPAKAPGAAPRLPLDASSAFKLFKGSPAKEQPVSPSATEGEAPTESGPA